MSVPHDENAAARLRAVGYLGLGMPEDALAELAELTSPDSTSLHLQVEVLFLLKDWSAAAAICLPMTVADPADAGWWIHGAFAQRRARTIDEAEIILRAGLTRHPANGLMLYNLACYACVQGRLDEARDYFRRAASGNLVLFLDMAAGDADLAALHGWISDLRESTDRSAR